MFSLLGLGISSFLVGLGFFPLCTSHVGNLWGEKKGWKRNVSKPYDYFSNPSKGSGLAPRTPTLSSVAFTMEQVYPRCKCNEPDLVISSTAGEWLLIYIRLKQRRRTSKDWEFLKSVGLQQRWRWPIMKHQWIITDFIWNRLGISPDNKDQCSFGMHWHHIWGQGWDRSSSDALCLEYSFSPGRLVTRKILVVWKEFCGMRQR